MKDECRRFLPLLHDWLEDECDMETAKLARMHLSQCPDCQQIISEWQTIADWIEATLPEPVPPDFDRKLKDSLKHQTYLPVSWLETIASWMLTVGATVCAVALWGGSLTALTHLLLSWLVVANEVSSLPVQWLQFVWDGVVRWL